MKGIVLAGGLGTRLHPLTLSVNKQLLPVYDKPMIYYPIFTLMLTGIKQILIISSPKDIPLFRHLLGDGSQWGIEFSYAKQKKPEGIAQALTIGEKFIGYDTCALILGDNLFFAQGFHKQLGRAASFSKKGCTIFCSQVQNPEQYGVATLDREGHILSLEEKPDRPKSDLAITGLYFFDGRASEFARQLSPSSRGELEIIDLIRMYQQYNSLQVELLGRGAAWLDTGTHDALLKAALFVQVIEERQGLKVCCPEEIAWRMGYIDSHQLNTLAKNSLVSGYGNYLLDCLSSNSNPHQES